MIGFGGVSNYGGYANYGALNPKDRSKSTMNWKQNIMKEEDKDNLKKIGFSQAYIPKPNGSFNPKAHQMKD